MLRRKRAQLAFTLDNRSLRIVLRRGVARPALPLGISTVLLFGWRNTIHWKRCGLLPRLTRNTSVLRFGGIVNRLRFGSHIRAGGSPAVDCVIWLLITPTYHFSSTRGSRCYALSSWWTGHSRRFERGTRRFRSHSGAYSRGGVCSNARSCRGTARRRIVRCLRLLFKLHPFNVV